MKRSQTTFLTAMIAVTLALGSFAQAAPVGATKLPTKLPEKLPARKKRAAAPRKSKIVVAPNKTETLPAKSLPEKKVAQKSDSVPPGRVTQLPAFKAKRRSHTDSSEGVVVRSMSASEYQAYAAQADAEAKAAALVQTKMVAQPLPIETIQIDDLENQVIDEISDAPHPAVADAAIPGTTVTTLPPLAPSVVVIPDSDDSIRKEMAALDKVSPKEEPPSLPPPAPTVATPTEAPALAAVAPAPTPAPSEELAPPPAVTIAPTSAPAPISTPAPTPTPPLPQEELARTENLANDLELLPARIHRLSLRAAYLDARYGNIENDLQNGGSTIGFSYSRDFDFVEGRVGLDFTHGLDQQVEMSQVRTTLLRVDAAYFFSSRNRIAPFVSSGLGYAFSKVRSYRSQVDGSTIVRDHLESNSIAFIPGGGVRFNLMPRLDLDLGVEYLGLFGGANASALGGLSAGGALGFTF